MSDGTVQTHFLKQLCIAELIYTSAIARWRCFLAVLSVFVLLSVTEICSVLFCFLFAKSLNSFRATSASRVYSSIMGTSGAL